MKAQKTWAWELKPLLDEYIFALIRAEEAREEDEDLKWHRASQRAASLADQLVLTMRARKAMGVGSSDEGEDPFADLDAGDELAQRRSA